MNMGVNLKERVWSVIIIGLVQEVTMKNKTAVKKAKQDEVRRLRNKSYKSFLKSKTKQYINEKDKDKKAELYKELQSVYDIAAKKHIYHPNKVARRKAYLIKLLKD